jgi:hypothetical protein
VNATERTEQGGTAYYTCDRGYKLKGDSYRTCSPDGTWSDSEPTCEAIDCGKPGEVVNGHTNTSEGTTAGATVHYMCDRGYIINGPASRTCGYDGNWTGSVPTCERVDCGPVCNPEYGVARGNGDTKFGARVYYTCAKGYIRNGQPYRVCESDGQWSGIEPVCEMIDCGQPKNLEHMNMQVDEGTLLGATVHYTCERGHKLSGPTSGRCGVDGEWSKTESICERKTTKPWASTYSK